MSNNNRRSSAFTLVELLVVIAIIGVLVALLLPAIQAAREAARRSECQNKLKQMGLSVQNFISARGTYPSGGGPYRPYIENYVEGGKVLGPEKQGLGWGFQILPYLEQGPLSNVTTTSALASSVVSLYVCPTRRPAVTRADPLTPLNNVTLTDYAAALPCGYTDFSQTTRYTPLFPGSTPADTVGEHRPRFFGGAASTPYVLSVPDNEVYLGAITRANWKSNCPSTTSSTGCVRTQATNVLPVNKPQQIEDGSSNTMLIGEKFVRPDLYEGGSASDDRGWSDGWDPDTMRSTCFQPLQDTLTGTTGGAPENLYGFSADVVYFGSAHAGGFNAAFCDASVHLIKYEVDPFVFDRLGDRRDGEVIDLSSL